MSKSLREQLADLGLVSEFAAKRAEKQERARHVERDRQQKAIHGTTHQVLKDYRAAVQERRASRADYGDIVVEYRRAHGK
jgi:hypothetical protein